MSFPAVVLTGPRRAGKTTLLKKLFPDASYVLLEDPDVLMAAKGDPRGFLLNLKRPVVLDEIQNVPELFSYIRTMIDNAPESFGHWFLTGSQDVPLMRGVTESMAGRAAIFTLLPFSLEECGGIDQFSGGFPEVVAKPAISNTWFNSYVLTYLERDVRSITAIKDLATFRKFLAILASRVGQILNKTDIASPLGVSVPTVTEWLNVLEITGQILLVSPFYENFGKRIIKSPKLFFVDPGLVCHLLGVADRTSLARSPFAGAVMECFVASELLKHRTARGLARNIYYFRDQQGLEVDFVLDDGNRRLTFVEVKAGKTLKPDMAGSLTRLRDSVENYTTRMILVHGGGDSELPVKSMLPGVAATSLGSLHGVIEREPYDG